MGDGETSEDGLTRREAALELFIPEEVVVSRLGWRKYSRSVLSSLKKCAHLCPKKI